MAVTLDPDVALQKLGTWGRYQIYIVLLSNLTALFCGLIMMSTSFTNVAPPFRCADSNVTTFDSDCRESCTDYEFDIDELGTTIATEWDLVCERSYLISMASSSLFVGYAIGSLIVTPLADKFGRKYTALCSIAAMVASGIATAYSTSLIFYIIARTLCGVFFAGVSVSCWVLGCEVMTPNQRATNVVANGLFWTCGYCLTGIIAIFVHDWRTLTLICSISCLLLISYKWICPESLHWLVTNNREEEAIEWICRAQKFNGVIFDVEEVRSNEAKLMKKSLALALHDEENLNILHIFQSAPLLIHTIVMLYLWLCNTFVYYGLSLFSTALAGDRYMNFILSGIVELPAYPLLYFSMNRFGRRISMMVYHTVAGVALFTLIFIDHDNLWLRTTVWLIGKFSIASSFMGVWLYGAEIFPTTMRGAGVGVCNVAARCGGILAPFTNVLADISPSLPSMIYGLMSILAALICVVLPETRNHHTIEYISDVDPGPVLSMCFKKNQHELLPVKQDFDPTPEYFEDSSEAPMLKEAEAGSSPFYRILI